LIVNLIFTMLIYFICAYINFKPFNFAENDHGYNKGQQTSKHGGKRFHLRIATNPGFPGQSKKHRGKAFEAAATGADSIAQCWLASIGSE